MGVKTIFVSSEESNHNSELVVYYNDKNNLFIEIYIPDGDPCESQFICLDKATAVKLVKSIRREISFLQDGETC